MALSRLFVEFRASTSQFHADMQQIQREVREFDKLLKPIKTNAENVGKVLSVGLTAPLVAAGALATKAGMEYESAFAGVRKTVNATEQELAALSGQFRQMARDIPITAAEFARIGEAAGQLGEHADRGDVVRNGLEAGAQQAFGDGEIAGRERMGGLAQIGIVDRGGDGVELAGLGLLVPSQLAQRAGGEAVGLGIGGVQPDETPRFAQRTIGRFIEQAADLAERGAGRRDGHGPPYPFGSSEVENR